jgi:hypothetical protein
MGQSSDSVTFFDSFESAEETRASNDGWKELTPTFWAPANAKELGLEKW